MKDMEPAAPFDLPPYEIHRPSAQALPVVVASPHSGRHYPPVFVAASRLDARSLRKSEDGFIDEVFGAAPGCGAPLLAALFPRAYLDVNREPFELDPDMFADPLPPYANTTSARVAAGLGTIARVVANGEEIYRGKLRLADAQARIDQLYRPYHDALRRLIDETRRGFGVCLLIDGHSMPSSGAIPDLPGGRQPDFVLGDCHGTSCASDYVDAAEDHLRGLGYVVHRNVPYAGGFTTRFYGRPREGVHALQIEINRALYMDEIRILRRPYLATLREHMAALVSTLGRLRREPLAAE